MANGTADSTLLQTRAVDPQIRRKFIAQAERHGLSQASLLRLVVHRFVRDIDAGALSVDAVVTEELRAGSAKPRGRRAK